MDHERTPLGALLRKSCTQNGQTFHEFRGLSNIFFQTHPQNQFSSVFLFNPFYHSRSSPFSFWVKKTTTIIHQECDEKTTQSAQTCGEAKRLVTRCEHGKLDSAPTSAAKRSSLRCPRTENLAKITMLREDTNDISM